MDTLASAPPLALEYLPSIQQIYFSPSIAITILLLVLCIVGAFLFNYYHSRKVKRANFQDNLVMARRALHKRGATDNDIEKALRTLKTLTEIDLSRALIMRSTFHDKVWSPLSQMHNQAFANHIQEILFPKGRSTIVGINRADNTSPGTGTGTGTSESVTANAVNSNSEYSPVVSDTGFFTKISSAELDLLGENDTFSESQPAATAATTRATAKPSPDPVAPSQLEPGMSLRMNFSGINGSIVCHVIRHDKTGITITIPTDYPSLIQTLHPGTTANGIYESGTSLMAFVTEVTSVSTSSLPFVKLAVWKNVWEVRKRDSLRLRIDLQIHFQHVTTAGTNMIDMNELEKAIDFLHPGRLSDISLGGCSLETEENLGFAIGDLLRFRAQLITGQSPGTFLGSIVHVHSDKAENENKSLHNLGIQFISMSDISQRLLIQTIHRLQQSHENEVKQKAVELIEQLKTRKIGPLPAAPKP
ncbi:MAG: PilZ domain-containing protein [Planctomycetota bacterium]|jgi:c-di-GMP-binding flagellar brake protein YcgR|nr:PilZ domain-containing protein [Planctomycetota bacterium]